MSYTADMKSVTYLIIISIVWSIISGILEKKRAKAKKNAAMIGLDSKPIKVDALKADPVNVLVKSLQNRQPQRKIAPTKQPEFASMPKPISAQKRKVEAIKSLHKENCPLPPKVEVKRESQAKQISVLFKNRCNIRTAIVLNEILGKPVSKK